jgi:hypothetical protein
VAVVVVVMLTIKVKIPVQVYLEDPQVAELGVITLLLE